MHEPLKGSALRDFNSDKNNGMTGSAPVMPFL